ncbi:unnamed protein product [Rhizopus stolonifer]
MTTLFQRRHQLLHMPFDLLLKVSEYLSFSDLWYISNSSQHCRRLGHQLILHKYHIDLSKPQINGFCHLVYSALAYASQHGYYENKIDSAVIQSIANRLAVEIYDRSSLRNWEACLDFLLDETLRIVVDHVFLDTQLDIIPKNTSAKGFKSTKMGGLVAVLINALYSTLTALFETEPTSQIHHRLLLNHINRHLYHISTKYHQHYHRRLYVDSSSTAKNNVLLAFRQHNLLLRSNFRTLVRFIGALVQSELLSVIDLDILTRQRIQYFFLRNDIQEQYPKKRRLKTNNQTNADRQLQLEENDFKMEIFLDLTRAVLLLQQHTPSSNGLNSFSNMLHDTVSGLISSKKSSDHTFTSSATSV